MKIIEMYGCTKPVYYFGLNLEVPEWTKYIAVDEFGNLYCFDDENKPWQTRDGLWDSDGKQEILAKVKLEGADWNLTLMTH